MFFFYILRYFEICLRYFEILKSRSDTACRPFVPQHGCGKMSARYFIKQTLPGHAQRLFRNSGIERQSKMQNGNLTGKRFAQCPVWPRESRAYPSSRQQHTLRWPTLKENLSHDSFFFRFFGAGWLRCSRFFG